jgi:hypothetical protein
MECFMTRTEAIAWLMQADELCGVGFHVDTPANEYETPLNAEFEKNRQDYMEFAEREGFDLYAFAMSIMPSFAEPIGNYAD